MIFFIIFTAATYIANTVMVIVAMKTRSFALWYSLLIFLLPFIFPLTVALGLFE